MNHLAGWMVWSFWMMVALVVTYAPYPSAFLREALAFFIYAAFFCLSYGMAVHSGFAFFFGLWSDSLTGTVWGVHGIIFLWMMVAARSSLARMGNYGAMMALFGSLVVVAAVCALWLRADFASLWWAICYATLFFAVMLGALSPKGKGRYG